MNNWIAIEKEIEIVKSHILNKFPGASYTIRILLWDDNTRCIECRHGDGKKIYCSAIDNGKLTYDESDDTFDGVMMDSRGVMYYPKNKN